MRRLSKDFFVGAYLVLDGLAVFALIVGLFLEFPRNRDEIAFSGSALAVYLLLSLLTSLVMLLLIYGMWEAIQDGFARTTPGKAIGFLFIPLFNLYWIFQALWGFSRDYNRFLDRHSVNAPKLAEGLFQMFIIISLIPTVGFAFVRLGLFSTSIGNYLFLLSSVLNYIIGLAVIAHICEGVNNLPEAARGGRQFVT